MHEEATPRRHPARAPVYVSAPAATAALRGLMYCIRICHSARTLLYLSSFRKDSRVYAGRHRPPARTLLYLVYSPPLPRQDFHVPVAAAAESLELPCTRRHRCPTKTFVYPLSPPPPSKDSRILASCAPPVLPCSRRHGCLDPYTLCSAETLTLGGHARLVSDS